MTYYTYLLVYSNDCGTLAEVQATLNAMENVVNWYRCLPNSFFVVSPYAAVTLSDAFRTARGEKGRFIFVDTATDRNGWLPRQAWDLMREPKPVGE